MMKTTIKDKPRVTWIIVKDFNTLVNPFEKLGGNLDASKIESMRDIHNFINDSNLVDLELHGS